ncbi:MAG: BTAD domain-containing putative transcriptional regulator [Eubacteriales bacterium]|nr:BTAD domain-containing putative transcriptional regulator [Eubacteriales bacterium]
MRRGSTVLSNTSPRAQQVWKLFKYIITNRTTPIPTDRLVDVLWPEGDCENPTKALYSLMYRLRSILANGQEQPCDYIIFQHNSYVWNENAPCFIDAEEFERKCGQAAAATLEICERIRLYEEALVLYTGDFLAESALDDWVFPWTNYYKRMYNGAVLEMCELYRQIKNYAAIVTVCSRAIERDPFVEKLHVALIRALLDQGQATQASVHYDHISNLLYKELGVQPSEDLQALYREIHRSTQDIQFDMNYIKASLQESSYSPKAFYCDMDVFQHLYHLEVRSMMRSGQAVYLAVVSLTTPQHRIPEGRDLTTAMGILKDVSLSGLRRSDVVSRYSKAQMIYLLSSLTMEDASMVMERIKTQFYQNYRGSGILFRSLLSPVDAARAQ